MLESNTKTEPKTTRSHIKSARGFSTDDVHKLFECVLTVMWRSGWCVKAESDKPDGRNKIQLENKTKQFTDSEKYFQ